VKARTTEIKKSLTDEVSKIGKAYLSDFDWKLHVIVFPQSE
jgi:hypothetical protein